MKFKTYLISFNRALVQEQEDQLIGSIQSLYEGMQKKVQQFIDRAEASRSLKFLRKNKQTDLMIGTLISKLHLFCHRINYVFVLNKLSDRSYVFKFAWEEAKVLNEKVEVFGKKIGLPGQVVFDEKRIIEYLQVQIGKLGFNSTDYSISFIEIEEEALIMD